MTKLDCFYSIRQIRITKKNLNFKLPKIALSIVNTQKSSFRLRREIK